MYKWWKAALAAMTLSTAGETLAAAAKAGDAAAVAAAVTLAGSRLATAVEGLTAPRAVPPGAMAEAVPAGNGCPSSGVAGFPVARVSAMTTA